MEKNKNYMGIDTSNYDKVKNLSMTGKQVTRTKNEYTSISKRDFKRRFIAIATVATIAGFGISVLTSAVRDKIAGSEYIHENRAIVTENTHRTADNSGYWYDTDDIAFSISTSDVEDKKALLYSVYANLNYDRLKHMNEIIGSLGAYDIEYKQYNDFEDYIIKLGFYKENGEADIEAYKKYMDKYICEMSKIEEIKSENGGKTK